MVKFRIVAWLLAALALAGTAATALFYRGEALALAGENALVRADLEAAQATLDDLRAEQDERMQVNTAQAVQRTKAKTAVKAVQATIQKEISHDETPRPAAGSADVDRLRRLTDAGNDAIRAASKLP